MIPSNTKIFNVINKNYSSGKFFFIKKNTTMYVFKVALKVSKLEIKNVFFKFFTFTKIKIRTVIIKKLIKNKKNKNCPKYKFFKKAYITIDNNKN